MSEPRSKRQRSGSANGSRLTPQQYDQCNSILIAVLQAKDGARLIATNFKTLPAANEWPDYYETIAEPICLDEIQSKLRSGEYSSPQAFYRDLQLVFLNAKQYNEDDSLIQKDAERLEEIVTSVYQLLQERGIFPPLPSQTIRSQTGPPSSGLPDISSVPGSQTPPFSSVEPLNAPSPSSSIAESITSTATKRKRGRPPKNSIDISTPMMPVKPLPSTSTSTPTSGTSQLAFKSKKIPAPGVPGISDLVDESDPAVAESLEIIADLEVRTPKLEEYGPQGWWSMDVDYIASKKDRFRYILDNLKTFKDANGIRVAESLEALPMQTDNPLLTFSFPHSLPLIEGQVDADGYSTSVEFDVDMMRLFEKGRRYYSDGTAPYGQVVLLQRYYQSLTSANPNLTTASTNFSSVPGGPSPSIAKNIEGRLNSDEAVTTFRISGKDRDFVDVAHYKGFSFSVGDFVHVMNADDPSKPICGQVFKVFVPNRGVRQNLVSLTVCWYYRPEQTVHPANRTFFENELFKTGHFGDHVIEDVIEKVGCQFYSRAIRGRPVSPFWYPGWPVYVCDSRYNDKDKLMVRIKNRDSCIPEELRKKDFMPYAPFSAQIKLRRYPSPLISGISGPGYIGEPESNDDDGEFDLDDSQPPPAPVAAPLTPRTEARLRKLEEIRANHSAKGASGYNLMYNRGSPSAVSSPVSAGANGAASTSMYGRTGSTTPVGQGGVGSMSRPSALPARLSGNSTPTAKTGQFIPSSSSSSSAPFVQTTPLSRAGSSIIPSQQPQQQQQLYQQPYQHQHQQQQNSPGSRSKTILDRSVVGNSGGMGWLSQVAHQSLINDDVANRFERDPTTKKILWFSGAPLALPLHVQPTHSAQYAMFLAEKALGKGADIDVDDGDEGDSSELRLTAGEDHGLDPRLLEAVKGNFQPDLMKSIDDLLESANEQILGCETLKEMEGAE
ncbi:Chromatin remodeling complex RSC, subunit RSC1/Polybromo and related proteins [Phaffia rhodozyma]|uniref:Chromatin remodeling complex RSC, subunit RSC1/Polybromo and related proteins n=1 Tax=Phaffia rhodozyma TaxID=264483 RepID=A0A0F7SRF8_PHARH|nr:Chromatin remodeling complex RSC, subunit RSC1/Polybromo and related proteins [Phaffia rhodozyma]